jgi:hypothetical protein
LTSSDDGFSFSSINVTTTSWFSVALDISWNDGSFKIVIRKILCSRKDADISIIPLPSQTSNEKNDVFTRHTAHVLRVKQIFFVRKEWVSLSSQKSTFFNVWNVRVLRVKTLFCSLLACKGKHYSHWCFMSRHSVQVLLYSVVIIWPAWYSLFTDWNPIAGFFVRFFVIDSFLYIRAYYLMNHNLPLFR